MDSVSESAATTFARMEVLAMQGVLRAGVVFLAGVVAMPFAPFALTAVRASQKGESWRKKLLCLPAWFFWGIAIAILAPFSSALSVLSATRTMVAVEWRERWRCGTALRPDGSPMRIPTEEEKRAVDAAVTLSVLRDYNDEARRHGQGIG